jgi:TRAP-type C4-dicarboxylate transport system permease small subunit
LAHIVRLLNVIVVLILFALLSLPLLQIVMRYFFGAPIVGAEELTRFLMILLVFLGFPLVILAGENIVMGELRAALPRRWRNALDLATSLLAVAACGFLTWVTWDSIFLNIGNKTPTLGIPFYLFLGAALVAFAGATIVHLVHLRHPPQSDTNVTL